MKRLGVLSAGALYIEDGPGVRGVPRVMEDIRYLGGKFSVAQLLWVADTRHLTQLWIHPSCIVRYGEPVLEGDATGWHIWPQKAELQPWYHASRPGVHGDGIDLAFPGIDDRAAWRKADTAQELLGEVLAYNRALDIAYSWSPGNTGSALIRAVHGGGAGQSSRFTRLDAPNEPPAPAMLPKAPAREMAWIRALSEQERECRWLHSFDKNGAYVAACAGLELGLGEWERVGSQFYHKGDKVPLPGYFSVNGYDAPLILPDVLDPDGYYAIHPERDTWVTTPALNAMLEHSAVNIAESYVWPLHSRVLAPWQARISKARTALRDRPLARETLKSTYAITIGLLGSNVRKSDTANMLYRPDWRHMIIGQSAANTWRRIIRAVTNGVSVVAAAADCIYVVSDTADPLVVALQAGTPIGQELKDCKVQDSIPLADVLGCFNDDSMGGYGTRIVALNRLRVHLAGGVVV